MVAQLSPLRRRMIEDMTDLDRSRKQITRLHRITGDAQDRRSAFRELAGNLQPGVGVDPVWWTPLKLIFEVSDAPLPNRLSAGVPATDGRSGAIWTHARGVGA